MPNPDRLSASIPGSRQTSVLKVIELFLRVKLHTNVLIRPLIYEQPRRARNSSFLKRCEVILAGIGRTSVKCIRTRLFVLERHILALLEHCNSIQ